MSKKNILNITLYVALTATIVTLSACAGKPEEPVEETFATESVSTAVTEVTTVTQTTTTTEATAAPQTTTATEEAAPTTAQPQNVMYEPPAVINQRSTSFGDMGCGGAAALMAMQALEVNTDIDTDAEYAEFWSSVPKSYNPTQGWNYNSGIWNPAYCNWVGRFTPAKRLQNYTTDDIKGALTAGSTVIPLVSLGDTGYNTHWFVVYGWYERDGVTFFNIADPWGGGIREYTAAKLNEKINEAADRKGRLGYGYETEAVIVSRN